MAGDTVTFSATGSLEDPLGNRLRYKLTAKPPDSTLELFDEGKENYLVNGQLTPDVDGVYTIEIKNELVAVSTLHYSNDGGEGLNKGVEVVTSVGYPTPYSLHVGRKLTRQIGFSPDACVLELHSGYSHWLTPAGMIHGVVTEEGDATKCPVLVDGANDKAKLAMQAATVTAALTAIGGYGYKATFTLPLLPDPVKLWSSIIEDDPVTTLGFLICAVNTHIPKPQSVHLAEDTTYVVTAADCTWGSLSSQRDLLNDILTQATLHVQEHSTIHDVEDVTAHAAFDALPPLGGTSDINDHIAQAVAIKAILAAHFKLGVASLTNQVPTNLAGVHNNAGDYVTQLTLAAPTTASTLADYANDLKAKYNSHKSIVGTQASYHAVVPTDSEVLYIDMLVETLGQPFIVAVNKLADIINAHVLNLNYATGAALLMHSYADVDARTDNLPRASDEATAIQLLEILIERFKTHFLNGTAHAAAVPTAYTWWTIPQSGVGTLHAAFDAALLDSAATVPSTQTTATTKLVQLGGFSKA